MKAFKICLLLLLVMAAGPHVFAQVQGQARVDSLLKELPKQKEDTNKVKLLLKLSGTYGYAGAVADANKGLELAIKLNWKPGIADAYFSLGSIYRAQVNYPKALENLLKALSVYKELGNKRMTGWTLNYIGKSYFDQRDFTSALSYFLKCLDIFREIDHKYSIAGTFNDIANFYWEQRDYTMAFEYYSKALNVFEAAGVVSGVGMVQISLGDYYTKIGNYEQALSHYSTGLRIYDHVADRSDNVSYAYTSVARFYFALATDSNKNGLNKICKGNKKMALQKSKDFLDTAFAICKETGESPNAVYQNYSQTKAALGDYKGALEDHVRYVTIKDSQFSADNYKRFNELTLQSLFDKKQDSVKMEAAKAEAVHQANEKRQKTIIYAAAGGLALLLVFLLFVQKEKKKADLLLLNILPSEVAEELKAKGSAEAKLIDEVTVLFTDFKGFTQLSEKLSPKELVAEINTCFSAFDNIMQKHGVEKIKTIGDAYMAAGGLPTPNKTHAEDVVKAALDIQAFMHRHKEEREAAGKLFFEIRIGVHTGPVVAGIVGIKKFAYDIWGDTVNTASRMESSGTVGMVNISETTYDLVKDKFNCVYRGEVEAKGKGMMKMYYAG
jgi:class 3 adenylate cyclase